MKKGLYIVLEGPDGSGKTTQTNELENHLKTDQYKITRVREPGSTKLGDEIRKFLLNPA